MKVLEFYLQERIDLSPDAFLLDIETTGLSPRTDNIFLIGILFRQHQDLLIRQYVAEQIEEEKLILQKFLEDTASLPFHISYNGILFDIGFLNYKIKKHGLQPMLSTSDDRDLLMEIRPLQKMLRLQDCRLKTLEKHFGLCRQDTLPSEEMISLYEEYVKHPRADLLKLLSLHNHDDLLYLGLLKDRWSNFLNSITWELPDKSNALTFQKIQFQKKKIKATLRWKTPLASGLELYLEDGYIQSEKTQLHVEIPTIQGRNEAGEELLLPCAHPLLPLMVKGDPIWENVLAFFEIYLKKAINNDNRE